jgi:drug/metabolite transporter (DMT)-like permease
MMAGRVPAIDVFAHGGLRQPVTLNHLLFLLMSLIWGMTWMATKVALAAVPPVFFGAARYVLVSTILLVAVRGALSAFGSGRLASVVLSGALVNVATYALLYWGMQFVASGIAGVVNMSLNPVFLFAFAILLGQERAGWRHLMALAFGIAGLLILFSSKATFTGSAIELWAAAAFVGASVSYSLGSVLSRPLLDQVTPIQLTAAQGLVAAFGMSLLSLALEPVSPATLGALMTPAPLAGLLFMVLFGTFIAQTIFLKLVRDWGAPRAGLFSFVSPVVALILGAIVLDEPLTWREVAGAAIMLAAAGIAVTPRRETPVARPTETL